MRRGISSTCVDLLNSRGLLAFAGAAILFRLADISMLPLVSEGLGSRRGRLGAIFMAGTIIIPQLIVAVAAPWVGHYAEQWGRKPILLMGYTLEPMRGVLLAMGQAPIFIMAAQTLDGIVGAIVTVMTVLVITDLTTGTGRFNLARGAVGTCTGIAAAASTAATGVIVGLWGVRPPFCRSPA